MVFCMISLNSGQFPKVVILHALFSDLRYGVSYRDLEVILAGRGITGDHVTLNRWVVKYLPLIATKAQAAIHSTHRSRRVDETYVRQRGKWVYLYCTVDKNRQTLDFIG